MLVSLVKVRDHNYKFITAKPFAPNLGAEIYGVDLSKPISEAQFADIFQAFLDHQVLFFKNQKERWFSKCNFNFFIYWNKFRSSRTYNCYVSYEWI